MCSNNNSILDILPVPIGDTTVCNNNCKSIKDIPPVLIVDITVCKNNSKSTQDIPSVPVVNTILCNSSSSTIQPLPDNFSSHQIPVTLNSLSNCFSDFYTQTITIQRLNSWHIMDSENVNDDDDDDDSFFWNGWPTKNCWICIFIDVDGISSCFFFFAGRTEMVVFQNYIILLLHLAVFAFSFNILAS